MTRLRFGWYILFVAIIGVVFNITTTNHADRRTDDTVHVEPNHPDDHAWQKRPWIALRAASAGIADSAASVCLPLRDQLRSCFPDLATIAIVANLAGEIEGCSCASVFPEGGLLQSLAILLAADRHIPGLAIADGGGNYSRIDGLLTASEVPKSIRDLYYDLFSGAVQGGRLCCNDCVFLIDDRLLTMNPRGRRMFFLHYIPGLYSSPRSDATSAVRRVLLRAALANQASTVHDLLPQLYGKYVIESIHVVGRSWQTNPALHLLRSVAVTEALAEVPAISLPPSVDGCVACHAAAVEHWSNSDPHKVAWSQLQAYDRLATGNPLCVRCHTTGLGQDRLFDMTEAPPLPYRGVSCDACHASGSAGPCAAGRQRATELTCKGCHTPGREGTAFAEWPNRKIGCVGAACVSGSHEKE